MSRKYVQVSLLLTILVLSYAASRSDSLYRIVAASQIAEWHQSSLQDSLTEQVAPQSWHLHCVACTTPTDVASKRSLQLDQAGYPHIVYGGPVITYAYYNGRYWQYEAIDLAAQKTVNPVQLALHTATGQAHVIYLDASKATSTMTNGVLKYARRAPEGWQIETVQSGLQYGRSFLRLDASGHPHLLYYDESSLSLRYRQWDGEQWQEEILTGVADMSSFNGMILDTNDQPYITYHSTSGNLLRVAHRSGESWTTQTIEQFLANVPISFDDVSLAFDQNDHLHGSYSVRLGSVIHRTVLRYAYQTADSWVVQQPAGDEQVWDSSLALDASGQPHLSYYQLSAGNLVYAYQTNQTWMTQTVAAIGNVGRSTSLALDVEGKAHISYLDWDNSHLKYAGPLAPLALTKQVEPSEKVRAGDSITYTLWLSGAGVSGYVQDNLPTTMRYITHTLTGTVQPSAVYSASLHAVLWQGVLATDTVQSIQFQVEVGQGATPGELLPALVNIAWLSDTQRSRGLKTLSIANGSHVYLPLVVR